MNRLTRYALALVIASAVTLGVAVEHDSAVLLAGTFGVYATTAAITLRYPSLLVLRRNQSGPSVASGVVAGGTTWGVLALAQGVGDSVHLGAGVLGFGLVVFGTIGGIWMVDEGAVQLDDGVVETNPSGAAE